MLQSRLLLCSLETEAYKMVLRLMTERTAGKEGL